MWFRRDLRINDHPALLAAIESAEKVIPLFILDKQQISEAGDKLLAYMGKSLRSLDESLGNRLHIIEGDQVEILKELIAQHDVQEVHISTEFERYGAERDAKVETAGIKLVRTGSPYAVAPGRVLKPSDATAYKVYTPFYKGWRAHGWRAPAVTPKKSLKEKEMSEDDERRSQEEVQKITDKFIAEIDKLLQLKESELLAI